MPGFPSGYFEYLEDKILEILTASEGDVIQICKDRQVKIVKGGE